jgi:predicted RNase H-like HicB family nuclease
MRFPVVIHKDPESDYGVTVPDLPGCFSAGETLDDALNRAVEAIELHLDGMLQDNEPIPTSKGMEVHQHNLDYAGGIWAMVTIDPSKISEKAKRVNITLPERLLTIMDQYAAKHGETRSGLIAQAAMEFIASQHDLEN